MLPELETDVETQDIEYGVLPTKTYKFDLKNKRIIGWTDGLAAYAMAAEKCLRTQRYAHIIYDGNYGFDWDNYLGEEYDFIKSAILREIQETLSQDDRYRSIENFIINQSGLDSSIINFNIICDEGTVPIELEV